MNFTIRKALEKDMPQVLNLIKELAIFEKEPNVVELTVTDLQKDGFGKHPAFQCFVGEINNSQDDDPHYAQNDQMHRHATTLAANHL